MIGLAEGSAPASGVFTQEPQTVTFLYKDKVVSYTVTFETGEGAATIDPVSVTAGESITLPFPFKANHSFTNWIASHDGTRYSGGSSLVVTQDIVLTASWVENSKGTIHFNGNGSDDPQKVPENIVGYENTTIVVPGAGEMTREGYEFRGWSGSAAGTVKYAVGSNYRIKREAICGHYFNVLNVVHYLNGLSALVKIYKAAIVVLENPIRKKYLNTEIDILDCIELG